ncbi:MAG: hypothetical protein WCE90_00840 [Candidatus Zixiibacteriota bacterium]
MALLAILIPLTIATLQDIYQKRRAKDADFVDLDLHVILDRVFKTIPLLIYVALIFLPMIPWNISCGLFRLFELIVSFCGIILMGKSILDMYRWVKGNPLKFRRSYLKDLGNRTDLETVWRSVWETKSINLQNEKEFFQIFATTIDHYLNDNKDNLRTVSKLLSDFSNFMNNRSMMFLVTQKEVFPKILEWHFKIWQKEQLYLIEDEKQEIWSIYEEINILLNSIFLTIERKCLERGGIESFSFLKQLKNNIENHKTDYVEIRGENRFYIGCLLDEFYQTFFDSIPDSSDGHIMWAHHFPEEWKITKRNIENGTLSGISLSNFIEWAQERIAEPEGQFDKKMDNATKYLFPEVDPITWAKILMFVISPYGESRIQSLIERNWNFGIFGRIKSHYVGSSKENVSQDESKMWETLKSETEVELKNTFDLAFFLFNEEFSKEKIEEYVKELNELKYEKDIQAERKRKSLLDIFSGMREFLNQQTKPAKE